MDAGNKRLECYVNQVNRWPAPFTPHLLLPSFSRWLLLIGLLFMLDSWSDCGASPIHLGGDGLFRIVRLDCWLLLVLFVRCLLFAITFYCPIDDSLCFLVLSGILPFGLELWLNYKLNVRIFCGRL